MLDWYFTSNWYLPDLGGTKIAKGSAVWMAGCYFKNIHVLACIHSEATRVSQNSCWLRFRRHINCFTFRQKCCPRIRHCASFVSSGPTNNKLPSYPVNKCIPCSCSSFKNRVPLCKRPAVISLSVRHHLPEAYAFSPFNSIWLILHPHSAFG